MVITIPIPDLKKPPTLKFAERCVNCGKPKDETLGITLNMGVQKRDRAVTMQLAVPMCGACAKKERSVAKVTLVPFLVVGLVVGLIAFVPAALISPEGTTPQTIGFPFVFGGFIGMIAGILAGSIAEFLVKILAAPFYGRLLSRRPLTITGFLVESDELIGLSAKYLRKEKTVRLEFENEEIAHEFTLLNSLEN
jgi:hypothetical protein